jgi:signal transduction histidine kinase
MLKLLAQVCVAIALLASMPAWGLDPDVNLNNYHRQTWGGKDGAPANISSIAQSDDGWMWVGTDYGLYRFDGLRFERYQSPSGRQLRGVRITTMAAGPNGDLWVGYLDGGVDLLRNGKMVALPAASATLSPVYDIEAAMDGSAWISTREDLWRYANGRLERIGKEWGLPQLGGAMIAWDQYEQLWAKLSGQWFKLAKNARRFQPTGRFDGEKALFSPDGSMWLRQGSKFARMASGQSGPARPRNELEHQYSNDNRYTFDASGNLWMLQSPKGIARIRHQDLPAGDTFDAAKLPAEQLSERRQLGNPYPTYLQEDREGNMWVGAPGGLERFRNQRIRTISLPEGAERFTLAADQRGRVWVGARGLDGLWDVARAPVPRVVNGTRQIPATGRNGALLTASAAGIEGSLFGKGSTPIPLPPGCKEAVGADVTYLSEDNQSLWAIVRSCGLYRYQDGAWTSAAALAIPAGARVAVSDRDGAMWLGYADGAVRRYLDGKLTTYAFVDGSIGGIRLISIGPDIVVSGSSGTAVLHQGRLWRLSSAAPETLMSIAGLVTLPNGDRWLHTVPGLAQVLAADWRASMQDPRVPLRMHLLDEVDGYLGAPSIAAAMPNAALDADGKIWFASTEAIGYLDLAKSYRNTVAPVLQINALNVDQRVYPLQPGLQLPSSPQQIEIGFSVVNLTVPERLQVWYKLEGVDKSWQAAGTRRSASYTKLAPGDYRFLLKAANRDGVWSQQQAMLPLSIPPSFTQSIWFYLLCAVGVGAFGYALYLLRMRQVINRMDALLGERLRERERIARALHDNWLQEMHGLVLNFAGLSKGLPQQSPARERMEQLLVRADGVLVNGRNAVLGLRAAAVQSNDVQQAFTTLGSRLQRDLGGSFALRIRGAIRPLDCAAWEEIYYIGYEALHNAYRHAAATRITLTLDYSVNHFALLVRDDGKGLPAEVREHGKRDGHWGLVGIRERACMVDGSISLRSPSGVGTELCLQIPAARAYAAGTRAGWRARLQARWRVWRRRASASRAR